MCYVRIVLFVFGWLSTSVCQMAPFGIESLLFGGLGAFPPPRPMGFPLGLGGLFGQGQFAPGVIGMPPSMGGYSMGSLPFPLFPTPCDMGCNQGGLFFANINVNQGAGAPGGGMPGAGGMPGGMPGMPPPGGMPGGMPGAGGMPGGMPGMPPPGGMPGGGIPTTGRPPTGGMPGGTPTPTRPPTGLPPTTMPPRPPQAQQPNMNAQFLYFVPNWSPFQGLSWPPLSMPFYG